MAVGSVEPLKRLHERWADRVHFVDVVVRQAHPGPAAPAYTTAEEKLADAAAYQQDEAIPWAVVVDDVEGSVHRAYGGLASPTYLIGIDGNISFFQPTTGVPGLEAALGDLAAQGGRGMVAGGIDPMPHVLPPLTDGWRALERGLPHSADDLRVALPGSVDVLRLGARWRRLVAPLTLRTRPLPGGVRLGLVGALTAAIFMAGRRRPG